MAETNWLVKQLRGDFPGLLFKLSDDFRWSPGDKTVYFGPLVSDEAHISLLHETAHGILEHCSYERDIELLQIERQAWSHAQAELAPKYDIIISDDAVENALDSYRDWLHSRTRCPACDQTGIEDKNGAFVCPACQTKWTVNDARRTRLKRSRTT